MSAAGIKAPRGTYDVLGDQAAGRAVLEGRARALLEGAGYERIETPVFEATELFARGVGASTDIVNKQMFTFEDQGGRSLTLRPEGTAPICRAHRSSARWSSRSSSMYRSSSGSGCRRSIRWRPIAISLMRSPTTVA